MKKTKKYQGILINNAKFKPEIFNELNDLVRGTGFLVGVQQGSIPDHIRAELKREGKQINDREFDKATFIYSEEFKSNWAMVARYNNEYMFVFMPNKIANQFREAHVCNKVTNMSTI